MVWSGLSNIKQERKYFWSISESFQTRVLKWILTSPWINENQIEMLFIHLTYHSLRIQKIFAVWYEDRAFQLLKFSMSQEVKKGPFAALTMESSKNFILTHLQKIMWFYLPATKDNLLGKVWGKTLFPCEMPWTAFTETLSITSRFKLEELKKIFPSRNCFRKFWSRGYCTCNEPTRRITHACTKHEIKEILIKSNTIRHYDSKTGDIKM